MVKGASVVLGLQSVLKDLNIERSIVSKSDASAAIAIASRRGLGKFGMLKFVSCGYKIQFGGEISKL